MALLLIYIFMGSNLIGQDRAANVADRFVRQTAGDYGRAEILTYYDLDDVPTAYAVIYRNANNEPFTVVLGARYDCSPVCEFARRLPNYYEKFQKAKNAAETSINGNAEFTRIYYFAPQEEYFGFTGGTGEVLVNTYSLQTFDRAFFTQSKPARDQAMEQVVKEKWQKYLDCSDFGTRYTGYIDSVPYIDWVYGCSPTAASMILWYWDPRGYGRLVDHFYTHWDYPENEWNECANVNRELALRMYTDTLSGGTTMNNIGPGIVATANTNNGYSFSSQTSPQGSQYNQYVFSWLKTEIDAQRPAHWNVFHYQGDPAFNHSITATGYDIILPDTFVVLHDTWTTSEQSWPLWTYMNGYQSYDWVVTCVPGGSNTNNVLLTFPTQGGVLIRGIKYRLTWTSSGTSIDHLKIWHSEGRDGMSYDSTNWTLVTNSAPNTGTYIWTVPEVDSVMRINIAGLGSTNYRYGADGNFTPFLPIAITDSSHMTLYGHCPIAGNAQDVVVINDYVYLAIGDRGIAVVNIADSSLALLENTVDIGGSAKALCYDGQYLYCTTFLDSALKIIDLASPTNPAVIGSVVLADQTFGVYVANDIAYVAARMAGLRIVSVATPTNPTEIGYFNTPGQSYDVCLVHDSIAVVADGTKDLIFLNVSNPSAPESLCSYSTPGIPKGIWYDGYLFVGDGAAGVGILDVSNPAQPDSVVWFNTPGLAYAGVRVGSRMLVADGSAGIRMLDISNINNPVEVAWLDSYGSGNAVAVPGFSCILLADGDDGLYLMGTTLGIEEDVRKDLALGFTVTPNPFSKLMNISFENGQGARGIELKIYDATGRLVRKFCSIPSARSITWDGTDESGIKVPAGIYFVELETGGQLRTKKVIFLR